MKKAFLGIFITILLFSLIFIVADLMNITTYIPLSRNYDWLAFWGAILGGLATLIGVYFTIKGQSETDKENRRISSLPVLEYKISYSKDDFDNSNGQLAGEIISHIELEGANHLQENSCEWHYNLLITNVGIGHAKIERLDFIFGDQSYNFIQDFNVGYVYKLIKQDETKSLKFMIYAPLERFEKEDFCYTAEITITYKDMLGNEYTQLIHSGLACSSLNKQPYADLHYYEPFESMSSNKDVSSSEKNKFILAKVTNSKIEFVSAKLIKNIQDRYNSYFWEHHGNTHESYIDLANKSVKLYEKWCNGASISELLRDEECSDFAGAYLSSGQVIKVYKYPDGTYMLIDDGRHRVAAAQELDLYIPVKVTGEFKHPKIKKVSNA